MKAIGKKMITGIAGSLVLGGVLVGALQAEVFADPAAATAPTAQTQQSTDAAAKPFGKGRGGEGFRGGDGLRGQNGAASVLGIDQQVLMQELQSGKTLAQIAQEKAGLTKEALIQKLVAAETQKLDEAVTAGKLTKEQADKMKATITERVTASVDSTKPMGGPGGMGKGHGGKGGPMGGGHQDVSEILGVTPEELHQGLQAGKSPAEIAQEKGVSRDTLVTKLKDKAAERINQFVDSKRTPKEAASTTSTN
jgi:ribosomal protein S13